VDPEPILFLQIGTDPTVWVLPGEYDAVARQLGQAAGPVSLPVAAPLQGQLVLSSQGAGSVSLLGPRGVGGSHPTGATLGGAAPVSPRGSHPTGVIAPEPLAYLYVPKVTAATRDLPGYPLDPGTDLAALERRVMDAMTDGTRLDVRVSAGSGGGLLVLNGAVLAFAVLTQAA
jgi:hypothetical protein